MAVCLIRTTWSGTSGGPGVTQLAVREQTGTFITAAKAQTAVDAMRTFWGALATYMPDEVSLTVSPIVDGYEETTNTLIGSTTAATPPTVVKGVATTAYAMAAGMKINLNTTTIRYGRRVRGAIFIVPAAGGCYDVNGMATAGARTAMTNAAKTLQTSLQNAGLDLMVWSRYNKKKPDRAGSLALVTGIETNEKLCILRGRRD